MPPLLCIRRTGCASQRRLPIPGAVLHSRPRTLDATVRRLVLQEQPSADKPRRSLAPNCSRTIRDVRAHASGLLSPDVVKSVFTTYNTVLLLPWALMIFAPNLDFTKAMIKSNVFLVGFSLVYAYLFVVATAEILVQSQAMGLDTAEEVKFLFTEAVADPDKMASMFNRPGYAAQDWVHLCTWDYFVGQWIYLQGLEKNIFTRLSLFATFNAGPWGLFVHWATEAITNAVRSKNPEPKSPEPKNPEPPEAAP